MDFERILIAVDESPIAAHAIDVGISLAERLRADVAFIHVVDTGLIVGNGGVIPAELVAELRRNGQALLDKVATRVAEPGKVEKFLREGKPAEQIVAAASEWKAAFVVVGTHARSGVSRLFLGSTAETVLRHAHCPVVIVRPLP